ncbi:MAG: thiopeptide-type bacteriocin biosynthesis protein [Saprospiraceae bacterium]|nr:thiopeptide-type bacteriocin biosynthesis protein [Saprospiraceae bacterium]
MQTWLSYHFYPLEVPDIFLARAVKPFLAQFVWPVKGARAFFVRYADEKGPHIRLRVRGEEEWLGETLRPAISGWFAERGEWEEQPYEAEAERFGGEEALIWAEEYFHVSTRVVLDRLDRPYTYGDAMYDALRMHTITAFAAGFDHKKAAWYFDRLGEQWFSLFFQPDGQQQMEDSFKTEVYGQFEISLAPQSDELRSTLGALWKALEQNKIDAKQPDWVRWVRGNQLILPELGNNLEKALPSLIHLNSNRLGVNNQDEVYLNFILSKVL